MRVAPRHHQGPSSAVLRLKIAIGRKTVATGIKQLVDTTQRDALLEVIQTGIRMEKGDVGIWKRFSLINETRRVQLTKHRRGSPVRVFLFTFCIYLFAY